MFLFEALLKIKKKSYCPTYKLTILIGNIEAGR
jgi:hypothetical protein